MAELKQTLRVGVKAETGDFEAGMKRVTRESKKTQKSLFEVGGAGAKAAAVGGAAFSSLGAGISLATASAEGLEGALASASGSIIAAFGAGGPVAGALSIAALGFGALIQSVDLFGRGTDRAIQKMVTGFQKVRDAQRGEVKTLLRKQAMRGLAPEAARLGVSPALLFERNETAAKIAATQGSVRSAELTIERYRRRVALRDKYLKETGEIPAHLEGDVRRPGKLHPVTMEIEKEKARQARLSLYPARQLLRALGPELDALNGLFPSDRAPGPQRMMGPRDPMVDFIGGSLRGRIPVGGSLIETLLQQIARNTADNSAKASR